MSQSVSETTNEPDDGMSNRSPLLPERHPNPDFFICDVFDAPPKDDMASMEHPIFSLSTKPDQRILAYEHNDTKIEIVPSLRGLATIHDKDILIYCISQLMAKQKAGEPLNKELYITAHDLLVATNREISGDGYRRLREALERLSGTRITTNIINNEEEITEGFGLIDSWRIVRQSKSGRMTSIKVNLSDWIYNAVLGQDVLTIHRDYFRLRKPMERRVYELARKHCGQQSKWKIGLETLKKKCGSSSNTRLFRQSMRKLVASNHLPDYSLALEDDIVIVRNRDSMKPVSEAVKFPVLAPETFHDARTVAPGYDVYVLEKEWQAFWYDTGCTPLKNPDKAFIGFCKRVYERDPNP